MVNNTLRISFGDVAENTDRAALLTIGKQKTGESEIGHTFEQRICRGAERLPYG